MDENGDPAEPLLLQRHDSQVGLAGQSSDAIEELLAQNKTVPYRWWLSLVGWESRILWFLSGASIIVSIFNFMLSLITQMFTGHLGTLELAGVSIANVGIQGLAYGIMETWNGFSMNAFKGLWSYFKLTAASAIMLCLEIWYSQGLVLISGLLPNPTVSLDSISVCMNYLNLDMQFMLGLSAAASIRVGNELGAAHPRVARFSVIVVTATSILISLIFSTFVMICRTALSKAFTTTEAVIAAVSELTPLLAISVFLNGIQPILSGVAIGSGWQALVAYVNLGTYYIIGLPVGCVLGFKTNLGATGIWWGMILGVSLQTLTLIILTVRTNWDEEVRKAADRLRKSADDENLDLVNGIA
ncbi:hypothetical protein IFM89_017662 [Coptis chinensis]|uniref:Uncharacterized protein n=1 Tax=Coptis chinensis TaxID=261450 RepID=A0A835LB78_9MAGN|nr:hypothetical protein IFM89_017662 [Coptis chinensis]